MTPITYEEATILLGLANGTIKQAVSRGVLTRLPRIGLHQLLIKEQVELFKGKRLSLSSLNNEQRRRWRELADTVSRKATGAPSPTPTHPMYAANPVYLMDRAGLEYLNERGLAMRMETPIGTTLFQPALADEPDSQQEQDASELLFFVVILLGLALLLNKDKSNKNTRKAERTLAQIGIEREALDDTQRDQVVEKLKHHPHETQVLKTILQEEQVIPAFV